jgi:hypothetical protein
MSQATGSEPDKTQEYVWKKTHQNLKDWGMDKVVKYLLNEHEALSTIKKGDMGVHSHYSYSKECLKS